MSRKLKYALEQKAYVSSYLDLYDRSVPGISVSKRNDTYLTSESLMKAIEANPEISPLHHSDRGFQYTREVFRTYLENNKTNILKLDLVV